MKLFGPLFAGAAALSGVTGTTCPAGDVFSEMTKEDLHEKPGFCPADTPSATAAVTATATATAATAALEMGPEYVLLQPFCDAYRWGVAHEKPGFCPADTPSATAAVTAIATATAATAALEMGSECVLLQPFCDAYRWGVAHQKPGFCPADTPSATAATNATATAALEMGPEYVQVEPACDAYRWGVASFDNCSVDGTGNDDGEEGHENGPSTDTADETSTESDVDGSDVLASGLESVLRLQRRMRKDPSFRVVLSGGSDVEPPSLEMFKLRTDLTTDFTPTKVVQLTADTQVRPVSMVAFHVLKRKESWTFNARDREERDVWINALVQAIDRSATPGENDILFGGGSATSPSDVLDLKTALGMKPRKVTLTGPVLTMCKLTKGGSGTRACENMRMFESSDVVPVSGEKDRKGTTRSLFRVTEYSFDTAKSWTFDAGSPDGQARWIAVIKSAIAGTKANGDEGDVKEEANASSSPSNMWPPSRGWTLGPQDEPLVPGTYLSNMYPERPTTMEVTEMGDVLLRPGLVPDRAQDPLWAHRVTATFGGRANGGLGCVVEELWQRYTSGDEIPVTLSVKNGRWRVGRGPMCTLGRSPAPKGSLRRFLPWDERGQEIREGALFLLEDDSVVIAFGPNVLWDSSTA